MVSHLSAMSAFDESLQCHCFWIWVVQRWDALRRSAAKMQEGRPPQVLAKDIRTKIQHLVQGGKDARFPCVLVLMVVVKVWSGC